MEKLNKNRIGLTLGLLSGGLHLLWSILVAFGIAQTFLAWWVDTHFIILNITIAEFNFMKAIILIIGTFVSGYIIGWFFASIYNKLEGDKKIK